MRREMVDAIDAANADPAIGAVVVTGAGRGFCAGADIEQTFNARASRAEAMAGSDAARSAPSVATGSRSAASRSR